MRRREKAVARRSRPGVGVEADHDLVDQCLWWERGFTGRVELHDWTFRFRRGDRNVCAGAHDARFVCSAHSSTRSHRGLRL